MDDAADVDIIKGMVAGLAPGLLGTENAPPEEIESGRIVAADHLRWEGAKVHFNVDEVRLAEKTECGKNRQIVVERAETRALESPRVTVGMGGIIGRRREQHGRGHQRVTYH
jgi:hypothetical protein